jgi:hypothetical protein
VRDLDVEVSYDDGASWQQAFLVKAGSGWLAQLFHPRDADFVSLRAAATDSAGNSVQQTILRAYRLE